MTELVYKVFFVFLFLFIITLAHVKSFQNFGGLKKFLFNIFCFDQHFPPIVSSRNFIKRQKIIHRLAGFSFELIKPPPQLLLPILPASKHD